ncbi:hypothetical protein G6F35_015119 [Rhizopus arrhizus]|nr:hypothetical protein G6F35_015119 [Rhizopus arrhizus]
MRPRIGSGDFGRREHLSGGNRAPPDAIPRRGRLRGLWRTGSGVRRTPAGLGPARAWGRAGPGRRHDLADLPDRPLQGSARARNAASAPTRRQRQDRQAPPAGGILGGPRAQGVAARCGLTKGRRRRRPVPSGSTQYKSR